MPRASSSSRCRRARAERDFFHAPAPAHHLRDRSRRRRLERPRGAPDGGPQRKIYAVIKADGYGHGAAEMGETFLAGGADALGGGRSRRGDSPPPARHHRPRPRVSEFLARGRARGPRPRAHADGGGSGRRPGLRGGGAGALRRLREDRRRARAPGRGARGGGEAGHRHAGAAAPAPGRALRPSARPRRAAIPPTPTGSWAASPRWWTSWRRAGCACPSGCSPPPRSCCASRRPT